MLLQDWYGSESPIIQRRVSVSPDGHHELLCHLAEIEFIYGFHDTHELIHLEHTATVKELKECIRSCIPICRRDLKKPETLFFAYKPWKSVNDTMYALNEDLDDATISALDLHGCGFVTFAKDSPFENDFTL